MFDLNGGPLYRKRTCATFSYDLSSGPDGEHALYELTTEYLRRTYGRALSNRPAVQLAMSVFQRRLASSTWALLRSFERRIDKLRQSVADLESGKVSVRDLQLRQRGLDREIRDDFFDSHGADEDARSDRLGERNEDYEEAVLGAMTAVSVEELQDEIDQLRALSDRARRLLERGDESKFEKLREVLEDPHYASEKWLIFSEHRDTVDYLIRRLEGLGFSGRIAQIHGAMTWPDRERQVTRFRRPDGARYLVATDAAGEGINLQFCRLMANYDIPWNPARLEQRMGRIHRYGQQHDVRIVNLVAGDTREGRVLRILLDKLDAIRRELESDKVFDVIGRLFDNMPLRKYMIEALTDARGVAGRIESTLTSERVRDIGNLERCVYGEPDAAGGSARALREELDRERYLRLLPGYVRRFVAQAAGLLDLAIDGDLDGFFSLVPRRLGALDPLLPALEGYSPAARRRLCVRRPEADAPCVWLHPGEPMFDALSDLIRKTFGRDAERGAIFIDPRADAPYFFHLVLVSVEQEFQEEGGRQILERRLLGLRHGADGSLVESPIEPLLLLRGAPTLPPGAVPLAANGVVMRAEAARFAEREVLERFVEDHRSAAVSELPERRRSTSVGFSLRAAELAARRVQLANRRAGVEDDDGLAEIKREQRALSTEKERALARLDTAADRIEAGGIRFLVHALAVPAGDSEETERYDERVEEVAVRIAIAWERERGGQTTDVSKPERARLAGLSDWPGFDVLSLHPGGGVRNIEVKGRAGTSAIQMEANEWKQACHLGERYWLYVVFDCATPSPRLVRVRDPFAKLLAGKPRNRRIHHQRQVVDRSLRSKPEGETIMYADRRGCNHSVIWMQRGHADKARIVSGPHRRHRVADAHAGTCRRST